MSYDVYWVKNRAEKIADFELPTLQGVGLVLGIFTQGAALPFIHIFDNSQHLTFAEEIVKSCFESCISWT